MGKFSKLVPDETPWEFNITEFVDQRLTILDAEEVETTYGTSYVLTVITHPMPSDDAEPYHMLAGGKVLPGQIEQLISAMREMREDFPVDVKVIEVRAKTSKWSYFKFVDPDVGEEAEPTD